MLEFHRRVICRLPRCLGHPDPLPVFPNARQTSAWALDRSDLGDRRHSGTHCQAVRFAQLCLSLASWLGQHAFEAMTWFNILAVGMIVRVCGHSFARRQTMESLAGFWLSQCLLWAIPLMQLSTPGDGNLVLTDKVSAVVYRRCFVRSISPLRSLSSSTGSQGRSSAKVVHWLGRVALDAREPSRTDCLPAHAYGMAGDMASTGSTYAQPMMEVRRTLVCRPLAAWRSRCAASCRGWDFGRSSTMRPVAED